MQNDFQYLIKKKDIHLYYSTWKSRSPSREATKKSQCQNESHFLTLIHPLERLHDVCFLFFLSTQWSCSSSSIEWVRNKKVSWLMLQFAVMLHSSQEVLKKNYKINEQQFFVLMGKGGWIGGLWKIAFSLDAILFVTIWHLF